MNTNFRNLNNLFIFDSTAFIIYSKEILIQFHGYSCWCDWRLPSSSDTRRWPSWFCPELVDPSVNVPYFVWIFRSFLHKSQSYLPLAMLWSNEQFPCGLIASHLYGICWGVLTLDYNDVEIENYWTFILVRLHSIALISKWMECQLGKWWVQEIWRTYSCSSPAGNSWHFFPAATKRSCVRPISSHHQFNCGFSSTSFFRFSSTHFFCSGVGPPLDKSIMAVNCISSSASSSSALALIVYRNGNYITYYLHLSITFFVFFHCECWLFKVSCDWNNYRNGNCHDNNAKNDFHRF